MLKTKNKRVNNPQNIDMNKLRVQIDHKYLSLFLRCTYLHNI